MPEFVDIDERTYNMDPGKLREYLETQCTRQQTASWSAGGAGVR